MVIIDLIGWITFALLLVGAGWAAWRVYGDLGGRRSTMTETTAPEAPETKVPASHDSGV